MRLCLLILALAVPPCCLRAATCTALVSGAFASPGTWSCGSVPGAADDVVIGSGRTVTMGVSATVNSLTLANGFLGNGVNNLTINTSLSVTAANGSLNMGAGTVSAASLVLNGNLNVAGSGNFNVVNSNGVSGPGNLTYFGTYGSGASWTMAGQLFIQGGSNLLLNGQSSLASVELRSGSTLSLGGLSLFIQSLSLGTSGGTVQNLGMDISVSSTALATYPLQVTGAGTFASLSLSSGVGGSLDVVGIAVSGGNWGSGLATVNLQNATASLGSLSATSLSMDASSQLRINGSGGVRLHAGSATLAAGSTVRLAPVGGVQDIGPGFPSFRHLIIDNASGGRVRATADLTVQGNLSQSGGSGSAGFDLNGRVLGLQGNFSGGPAGLSGTGTLRFNGGLAQSLDPGSNASTFVQALQVSAAASALSLAGGPSLSVTGSVSITAGSLNLNARTLWLAGSFHNAGVSSLGTGTLLLNGPGSQAISGSSTFDILSRTATGPGQSLVLPAGLTQTVSGGLYLSALASQSLALRSSSAGNRAYLNATGTRQLSSLDVQDSYASTPINVAGQGCVDSGNNLNWTFLPPTSTPSATPSNTPTSSHTPVLTPTPSSSSTPTPSRTTTATPSATPSVTATSTETPSATPSATSTATPSVTLSGTPTPTATLSATATPSPSASITPSSTITLSATASQTPTGPQLTQTSVALSATSTPSRPHSGSQPALLGPVPVKRGQPLCLAVDRPDATASALIHNVAGERVARLDLGASGQACLDTRPLAPGVYYAHLERKAADGSSSVLIQKLAVLP